MPGMYFRMLGYFEGIDIERVIAWRADSLGIRAFLQLAQTNRFRIRRPSRGSRLIGVETHKTVFVWVLSVLAETVYFVAKRSA
jgi:hypothetical protein